MLLGIVSKIASWIANIVEPDQTAACKQSDLGLQCLHEVVCLNIYSSCTFDVDILIYVSVTIPELLDGVLLIELIFFSFSEETKY